MEYWMARNGSGQSSREETIEELLRDPGSAVLFLGYPPWLLHFAAGCCILFMLVGIPGNLFTIVALFHTRKLRNATAVFIMNLSISDLMFCCFNLPLATSTFWHSSWHHGPLLCRLFPLLRYGLVAVSLFTVLAITINRYVMIGHPRLYPRLYKAKYLIPMVLSTWTIAFGVLIVTWFGNWGRFGLDVAIGSCSILPDVHGRSPKEFLFVVAFLIPCIAIVVCYARIFYIVRTTANKSRKGNRNARVAVSALGVNQLRYQRRSASPRNQEEELSLSVLGSSCAASILCVNFPPKRTIVPPNRPRCSSTPSRSAIDESSSAPNLSLVRQQKEREKEKESEKEEEDYEGIRHEGRKGCRGKGKAKNKEERVEGCKGEVEVCDGATSSLHIKIDDIPYVDDSEAPETVLASNDRIETPESPAKCSTTARNAFERRESGGSSKLESTVSVQRSNSKRITGSDRWDGSRSRSRSRSRPGSRSESKSRSRSRSRSMSRSRSSSQDRSAERPVTRSSAICRESRSRSARKLPNLDGPPRMSHKDKKLLKMILVIFSSFVVCYLPITVTKTFKDAIDWRGLNIAGYILIYLTTCINPVVYVVMSSEYRSAYKNVLLCRSDSAARRVTGKPLRSLIRSPFALTS